MTIKVIRENCQNLVVKKSFFCKRKLSKFNNQQILYIYIYIH